MPGKINKAISFLTSNKWMRILYVLAVIGIFSWLILSDQSIKIGDWFQCDFKSKVNVNVNK
jgi:hypothetical protein